jgi:protease IV
MWRTDRVLALALIVVSLFAALSNWLTSVSPHADSVRPSPVAIEAPDIALIQISGSISEGSSGGGFLQGGGSGSHKILKAIKQARDDKAKAILLQINSPGGTASASNAIYRELIRTRQNSDTKVVALLGDVAASGGYYVASAADHIVANADTLTGSIGVIIRTQNLSPLLEKVGVENGNFKSGQFKDILSPYRESTPGEQALLQGLVDESYQGFLEAIAEGRDMPIDAIKPYADGRVLSGKQALEAKLVDSLGNYFDAIETTKEIAQISAEEPTIRSYPGSRFQERLSELLSTTISQSIPGVQQAQQALQWNQIPLALWE